MKQYFCHIDYYATGEGVTANMAFVVAESKDDALAKFCKQHFNSQEGIEYFKGYVDVMDPSNELELERIEYTLKGCFTKRMSRSIIKGLEAGALFDFSFQYHVNYS
jgi:hypothetical protein